MMVFGSFDSLDAALMYFLKVGQYGMWQYHIRMKDWVALELNVTTGTQLSGGSMQNGAAFVRQ